MRGTLQRAVDQSPVAIIISNPQASSNTSTPASRRTPVTRQKKSSVSRPATSAQDKPGVRPGTALWQALCAGRDWRGELLNRRKNGRLYWDDVHIVPLMNAAGKVAHYLSIQEDISERKRNEDTLRLWATVFENSGEAVMITDAGNRIVSVNQAFTDITGFAPGEVIGEQPSILGSGRHEPAFFADMWHKAEDRRPLAGEIWDRRKSGEIYQMARHFGCA